MPDDRHLLNGPSVSERRCAFLAGEGTLTMAELRAWAEELGESGVGGFPDDTLLMVTVTYEDH